MFTLYIISLDKSTCVKGKQIFLEGEFFTLHGEVLLKFTLLRHKAAACIRGICFQSGPVFDTCSVSPYNIEQTRIARSKESIFFLIRTFPIIFMV